MFPLPALPLVPKLHRFFEPEQTKTFALIFGIALLVQSFLPWSGPGWFNFGGSGIWPMIAGVGLVVLTFVPGLADKLPGNTFFVIAAGVGVLGLGFSFVPVTIGMEEHVAGLQMPAHLAAAGVAHHARKVHHSHSVVRRPVDRPDERHPPPACPLCRPRHAAHPPESTTLFATMSPPYAPFRRVRG